jgi:hypothetical protein
MSSFRLEPEAHRIAFLVRRDGEPAARAWVARTLEAYRDAVSNPASHASLPTYRARFRKSISAFECWLEMASAAKTSGDAGADAESAGGDRS